MTVKVRTHTLMGFRHVGNPGRVTRTPGMTLLRVGPFALLHIDSRRVR